MMRTFLIFLCLHMSFTTISQSIVVKPVWLQAVRQEISPSTEEHNIGELSQDSTIKDRHGNIYTVRTMSDNKQWITDNLKVNIPGSFCHGDIERNCYQYGRLYTWESARKACNILGEGWRLPTNDEWRQMVKKYGGLMEDPDNNSKAAYKALLYGGSTGFNVVLGGNRDLDSTYARLGAHGFYWTSTETNTGNAWFYNFGKGGGMVNRHKDGEKSGAFSVRCVRNVLMSKENR